MGQWRLKAVALPAGEAPETAKVEQPAEDQADLPPCDGPDAVSDVTELVSASPWAQTMHIRVLDIGPITKTTSPEGVTVCHTKVITNGGTFPYDFHGIRENGKVYLSGHRR
ncbi:MAG: hypothetical protein JO227_22090 [Acetobacteraceae bacterium]|nr:hypothetical protein [Acetobacteraceae bacterium]